ncbi:hypothetical protein ACFVWF_23635 [Rhodococcus qingshengii]|uniref:hypothetical protein n=1 Tax=Rhodococcus qingshengii TaxID=334542 RepID=UPI0036DE7641
MTCRVHTVFDDPTCIYCNSVATRRAAQESAKAQKQMLDMHQRAARAQRRTTSAAKSEVRRQESIEWSQQQKQKKQAKSAATKAARQAQGGGLLPNEKLKIAAVLLLLWGTGVVVGYQDRNWFVVIAFLAVGVGVGYLALKRVTRRKRQRDRGD